MNAYLKAEGFDTLHILHNNSYSVERVRPSAAPAAGCSMWASPTMKR